MDKNPSWGWEAIKAAKTIIRIEHPAYVCVCVGLTDMKAKWTNPEAEFLDVIGTKVLGVFLLAIYSHLYKWISLNGRILRPNSWT